MSEYLDFLHGFLTKVSLKYFGSYVKTFLIALKMKLEVNSIPSFYC